MKVALFFGSFNPVHHGHLIIANHVLVENIVDQVWFIVTPLNPFKQKTDLINEYNRLHLVKVAIEGCTRMKASDIEFKLPKPNYTIDTLDMLKSTVAGVEFVILLGADSYQNILRWKEGGRLLEENKILVYKRLGFDYSDRDNSNVTYLNSPIIEISATEIRKKIKNRKSVKFLMPEKVIQEIELSGLYRND